MKNKFQILPIVFLLFVGLVACEDDGDGDGKNNNNNNPCSVAWTTSTSDESQAVTSAAIAWGSNPTTANCEAYKDAWQDYLNALKSFENCSELSGQNRTDWENSIAQAEAGIAGLNCNQGN